MTAEEFLIKNAFSGNANDDPVKILEAYAKQEAEKAWKAHEDLIMALEVYRATGCLPQDFKTYWQHRNDKEEAKPDHPDHCHCDDKYIDRSVPGKIICKTCGKPIC